MSPLQQNVIRTAVDNIRRDHPKLFGVLSATQCTHSLSQVRRELNYLSPEDFTDDYHQALDQLQQELKTQGYTPPTETDTFEERTGLSLAPKPSTPIKLPSPQVVDRWYKGHILHEAFAFLAKQNHWALSKLWDNFPQRRTEIEIALTLAPTQTETLSLRHAPIASATTQTSPSKTVSLLPSIFALAIILMIALNPPQSGQALKAITTNFQDALTSAQGIFDFSKNALKKAEAPGKQTEPPPPKATSADIPKPVPRPEIALPQKPKIELASLPKVPRQLDIPTSRPAIKTPPRVATPTIERGAKPSSFFGSRPDVQVSRPTLSMPDRPTATLPTTGAGLSGNQPAHNEESGDLQGYRPAGRIGFSSFQASRGLSAELVRLTRIERALSRLKKSQTRTFEKAQLTLAPEKARIHFQDGIAFSITFRFGRLDDIQIFARSGLDKPLNTETQARRGIQFLDRALSNS